MPSGLQSGKGELRPAPLSNDDPGAEPAFQPYWGKPVVRNDRGDRGNVGIIRSPVRASILPDRRSSTSAFSHGQNPKRPLPKFTHCDAATRSFAGSLLQMLRTISQLSASAMQRF